MSWYRAGNVTVTNGSPAVVGAGTDFVGNTQTGEVFRGPDGRIYEIAAVVSATQLTLAEPYLGGTGAGQGYAVQPTASFARDLALGVATLLNTFGAVRDGIGQGSFPDGTVAAPGFRFASDQDTGLRRVAENTVAIVAGGVDRLQIDPNGDFSVGAVGSAGRHGITKAGLNEGGVILQIDGGGGSGITAQFVRVNANAFNGGAAAALMIGNNTTTNRSISAGGTLNASGADYAEYMTKAAGCGTIAPGDVCGVDGDGRLTKTWSAARSFVVKSTDPAYVGGDVWGRSVGTRPDEPATGASDADRATHAAALADWEADLEAARQTVDRIAFCGQVPVNVSGDFAVGDYLIAVAAGAGIKAVAVAADDITFDQYRRRFGKVWAVRDGRAWVDVQHG